MYDPVIADLNRFLRHLDYQNALDEFAERQGYCAECGAEKWEAEEVYGFWKGHVELTCRQCGNTKMESMI